MVICQGCGQAFEVPAGYGRNKIQCPGCGVICAVPADAGRQPSGKESGKRQAAGRAARRQSAGADANPPTKEPALEDQAAAWMNEPEPEPAPLFDDEPPPEPKPAPASQTKPAPKPQGPRFSCRRCGRLIKKQRECPSCDGALDEPTDEAPVPTIATRSLDLDDPAAAQTNPDLDEDSSPYLMADKDLPTCPQCRKEMTPGAVLCASCGFDLRSRKKAVRTYQPINRSWDTDWGLGQRLFYMGLGQGVHWFLALVWAGAGFSPWPFVVAWPLLTVLLCFLLGTYDRLDIERDQKGRSRITKQWRFCFVPLAPVTTPVRGFEGVTTGQWHDAGVLEWIIFLFLVFSGVIPALIYWYNAIHKVHYHVALAGDHGHAEVWVYRGSKEEQMNEIADVLCNASGLSRVG